MKNSNLLNRLLSYSHEKQSPQRFGRYAAMLIMLLTLGVGQMWANYEKFRGNIYYNNSSSNWSYVSLVVGKDDYSCAYLFSHLSNTNLYYKWIDYSDWNDCYFFNESWGDSNCESTKPYSRVEKKTRWQPYKQNYNTDNRLYFNGTDASSAAGDLPTYTATLKVKKSTDGGDYTEITSGSWPATLNLKGTYMNGNNATGQSNFDTSSGDKATYGSIPVTGEVTMTLGASADSKYEFVGWGTGSSASTATTPYTYNITGNTTYYAFFRTKEYTIAYNGGVNAESGSHANDTKYHSTSLTLPDAVFTRAGYAQTGWATSDGGAQAYALGGTYTANSAATLYPVWTAEVTHDVTVYYKCGGTAIGDETDTESGVGVTTTRNVTAPTIYGYTFSSWTLGNGIVNRTAGSSTTTNPIVINTNATDDYVLTANYTEDLSSPYIVSGGNKIVTAGTTWRTTADANNKMNKKTGYSSTYDTYFTVNVTAVNQGSANSNYQFKIYNTSTSAFYGLTGSDQYYLNRAESGTAKALSSPGINVELRADALGEYELKVNYASDPTLTVTYPTAYAVTFGKGTGGGSVTAKYSSVSFDSGTKVQSGKTVRFTQTASTGYQFKEWNTKSNGSGEQLSTNSSYYDHTVASTNNVYAIYNPRQYAIPLNDQDATTAVSPSSVNATYKSLTLSSAITNPEKDGYTFGGWYSAVGGGGYLIINTSGALQASKSGYTDAAGWTRTSGDNTVYAKWTQVLTLDKNGGTTDGSLTVIYKKTAISSHTPATRTGYTLAGYYDADNGGNKIINADGTLVSYSASVSSYIRTDGSWGYNGTPTLYAQWTANQYDVTLKPNGATTGSDQVIRATYDATMPTQTKTSAALVAPTKTGYTLQGFYQNSNGTGTKYYNANMTSANNWDQDGNANIWAKWQANPYVVTLDVDEVNQGTISGATTRQDVTYDGATTTVPNRPTAANGYALDGYYTDQLGEGTKVINGDGTWIASVLGYTDEDAKWVHDGDVTLYAYYKKAEITNLVAAPGVIAPGETITITPTIEPTPTGTTKVCWEVQYSNGTPLPSQPTFTPGVGNAVSFPVPSASATYIIQATLAKGSSCPADPGDVLSTRTTTFQVAGEHTVTLEYKCGDEVLKASTTLEGIKALEWSDDITKIDIFGYRFVRWDAGDGVSIKNGDSDPVTTSTNTTINIKASYDGKLTAVYAANDYIYFKNTLGWSGDAIYVYFYNASGYWNDTYGSGSYGDNCLGHGRMQLVDGETDIYYWDYGANITGGASAATQYVSFTWGEQANKDNFSNIDVVYPTKGGNAGFKTGTPMFVPLSKSVQDPVNYNTANNKTAPYYNKGYWTKYKGGTGYWVDIFYSKGGGDDWDKSVGFVEGESAGMPYTSTVNLTGGSTLGFKIGRKGAAGGGSDVYYYATTDVTMSNAATAKSLTNGNNRTGITTNIAGDYVFTLTCASDGALNISVQYPAATGDYRVVYKDLAAWSGSSAHNANWYHPSATIGKNRSATEPKTDIVSFYVSKAVGASASMKFQYISSIDNTSVTWSDVEEGSITIPSIITESGVYNFYLSQPAGGASITVDSVRPYTGNYYIRSTMANSKWDNYSSDPNHIVNHSDYAESERGFTHYWVKYVSNGSDIRYVIANDYSPCISDTLVADVESSPVTTTGGSLSTSEAGVNIRSMWDYRTNKLSRAYLTGPVSNQYLLLRSLYQSTADNNRVFKSWTSAESNTRLNHSSFTESAVSYDLDTLLFKDNQNWMYQLDIYARPAATYKLSALVNGTTTFIRGLEGNYTTAANIDTLLGGNPAGTKAYHVRMVYDFKSDRMMKAWMPEGEISEDIAINADIMLVREHQDAGEQISFDGGSLTKVKTVYGVMRFNRWTLNNKEKTGGHSVVADPKSAYERGLYWISFPFDVNLSDVFGFGSYGTDWIIMEYDGAARAREGYWSDSEGFWKYVMSPTGKVLKAGTGYVLALDLDRMKDDNTTFWANNIQQVELYFPSAAHVENIEATNVLTTVDEHECTINRHTQAEKAAGTDTNINKNRTKADSHWNIIGIPSYANYGDVLKDGEGGATITWKSDPSTQDLPFLYEWNAVDNTYSVQSGTTYPFKAMHAYMVQYHGNLYWSLASATPPSIVARSTYAEKPESVEMRLELQQNEMKVDQTFVKLSNDENASANFAFDEDLCKEFNANKANIYTIVENYLPVAGNTMPMSEQTTVVPVGVRIAADGDYTFAIPDGTEGIGVTLIDNETGIRTSLSALEYTINLSAGDYADRFFLEISPISQISTDIESISDEGLEIRGARKIMIDGLLYIVKDGKLFDAQGRRL